MSATKVREHVPHICYRTNRLSAVNYGDSPPAPKTSETLTIRVKLTDAQVDICPGAGGLMDRTEPLPAGIDVHKPDNINRVRFCLPEPPVVEGFGLPFSNPGDETERWLHDDKPIVGDVTLSGILAQENFEFITVLAKPDMLRSRLSLQELGPAFQYPHGDHQNWDESMERGVAGEIFGPAFPPVFALPDIQPTVAVIAQSVFQDYWWQQDSADAIELVEFSAYMVPVKEDSPRPDLPRVYYMAVHVPDGYQLGHEDAWRVFLKDGLCEVKFNDQPGVKEWQGRVLSSPGAVPVLQAHNVDAEDMLFFLVREVLVKGMPPVEPTVFANGSDAREALKRGSAQ